MQLSASHCPVCKLRYDGGARRKSRDHIVPQEWGGGDFLHGDVRNTRIMCQDCNGWRAHCGHCTAALKMMRDVAADRGEPLKIVAREWDMYAVAAEVETPLEVAKFKERAAIRRRTAQVASSFYIRQRMNVQEQAPAQNNVPLSPSVTIPAPMPPRPPQVPPLREAKPYTLKNLRAKGPAFTPPKMPKELTVVNGMVVMRWNVRETGRNL